jgi:hypothetical protein
VLRPVGRWPAGRAGLTAHAFQDVLGLEFCVVGSRVFHEEWVSDFAWWCLGVLARGWGEWFCEGFGFSRVVLAGAWVWLGLECDGGLGTMVAWVRREKKSPGTTSEERLCAEAPVRCRSCTSQPAISDVVTRDGPELYNRGDRSSMTAFGALLVVKLHSPVSLAWVSPALDLQNSLPSRIGYSRNMVTNNERMQRDSSLIATISRKLPEFAKACEDEAEWVLLHQDAFAADHQEDEYTLLGMAIKYAGLRGKEVRVIGRNRSSFAEEERLQ